MSRSVHCSRAAAPSGPVPHHSSEPSESFGVQRAVRAAADVVRAAPVEELPARAWRRRAPRRPSGSAAPTRRARARPGSGASRPGRPDPSASTSRSPSTLQRSPAQVREVAARGEAQLAARGAHGGLAVGVVGEAHHEVDALEREQRPHDARDQRRAARRGRARRPAPRASSGRARSRALAGLRSRRRSAGSTAKSVERARTGRSRPRPATASGREQTITAWSSRNASGPPAACISRSICWSAAASEVDLGVRAVLVRVRVVVGQRQQQEVEEVVLDEVRADAAGVLVAHARAARAASGSRSGATRRCRRRRTPAGRAPAAGRRPTAIRVSAVSLVTLVPVAAAVHEVGRAGGAHVGVVERLEHRRRVRATGARRSCCRSCR